VGVPQVTVAAQLGLIVASIAMLLGIMAAVRALARRYGWSPELQRKCVHIATGAYALTLPLTFSATWPVLILVALALIVMLVLRLPRFAKEGLGSALHGVERESYGELLLALAVGFVFFESTGRPVLYVLPITVLTLSDAAAALTGTRYGKKFFQVEAGTKSHEGVAMFFLVTWIVAMVLLLLMTDIERVNVILLALVIAAFGALVEANSWRGLDNLFVPVGIHLFLASHLQTPPVELLLLAFAFVAILMVMVSQASRLGLSAHAASSYTVLVFLICAVTAPHNAILPLAAVFGHLLARNMRPTRSPYPDLDFLAVIAGVALFWLFLGEYTQKNALNVYNLTFAGSALVFLTLASGRRLFLAGIAAALLFAGILEIAKWNPAPSQWQGILWPWVAASLALCLCVPALRPDFLDRHRSVRTVALALPVPLVLFVTRAVFA
jgi:phytol kinase